MEAETDVPLKTRIVDALMDCSTTQAKVAERFDVSPSYVSHLKKKFFLGRNRRHLTVELSFANARWLNEVAAQMGVSDAEALNAIITDARVEDETPDTNRQA